MKKIAENENIESLLSDFIDSVEEYVSERVNADHISDVINQGIKVFMRFPEVKSASLFLLNDLTYEFEHNKTFPEICYNENTEAFNTLVENGIVGSTLESGNYIKQKKSKEIAENCIIFPLITSSSGVIGLFILFVNRLFSESKNSKNYHQAKQLFKFGKILSGLFAANIENAIFFKNLNKAQSLLEQKVAARTMSLAQSKRELQTILNTIQTGILLIDEESGRIVNTNPVASVIIGLNQDTIVGQLYTDFIPPAPDNVTTDKKRSFESSLKSASGKTIPVLRDVSHIILGSQKYRIESFLDITDRKRSEVALRQANELLELKVQERTIDLQLLVHKLKDEVTEREKVEKELRRLLEKEKELGDLKTRFISMVSHEFRTPMTIIRSAAQMIDKFYSQLSESEKSEKLKRILVTVDTMTDLLENVLFIGKTDSEKIKLNPKITDLKIFCLNVINDIKLGLNEDRDIRFECLTENTTAYVDTKLIRHILFNLLSNAIKYSDEKEPIDFTLQCDKDQSVFVVRDHGIGIPEEEQDKIFDIFHRARNVGSISGTGLGMSVILRSIKIHQGKIDLASKIDEGTTFKVTIPNIQNV